MAIPDEDLGPQWLRDYGSLYDVGDHQSTVADDGNGVRVDMPAMDEFASALRDNVDADYVPHAKKVFEDMSVPISAADARFTELYSALQTHDEVQQTTVDNVAQHGNGAVRFAESAREISQNYRSSDAYSAARLSDVRSTLGVTPTNGATPGGNL